MGSGGECALTSRLNAALLAAMVVASPSSIPAQEQALDHHGAGAGRLSALCGPHESGDRPALLQRQRELAERVKNRDAADSAWRSYGCVLSQLYAATLVDARPAPVSQYGIPAIAAFLHVLEHLPGDSESIVGVATLAFDITEGPEIGAIPGYVETLAASAYAAVRAGVTAPIVMRLCTEFSFAISAPPTSRYCTQRALTIGADSSWHLIRATWLALFIADTVSATRLFDAAVAAAHDAGQIGEIAWHVRGMVDEQSARDGVAAAWTGLSDSARVAWVHERALRGGAPGASFAQSLVRAEGVLLGHGPIFTACPYNVMRNGAGRQVNGWACTSVLGERTRYLSGVALINRLWDPATGKSFGLVTYALDRSVTGLVVGPTAGIADVDFSLRLWEWELQRWRDTTYHLQVAVPNVLPVPPYAVGSFLIAAPEGTYSWTAALHQPGRAGRLSVEAWHAPADSAVSLSDLILGAPNQHLMRVVAGDTIVLAPWNTLPAGKPFELYVQVRNTGAAARFTVNLLLRRIVSGKVLDEPELSVKFAIAAATGITPLHREIDVSRVEGANHRLEVELLDASGQVVVRRTIGLFVR